jgi:hypothetical protein
VREGFENWAKREDWVVIGHGDIEELSHKIETEVRRRLW